MRIPIAHAWVARSHRRSVGETGSRQDRAVDLRAPDFERFPALRLAYDALRTGRA